MAGDKEGPGVNGAPQKSSQEDFLAMLREIKEMKPPVGCDWIEQQDRIFVRRVINAAMRGEPVPGVHIYLEMEPDAPASVGTPVRIEFERWRWQSGIRGWTPGLKDAHAILCKLDPACGPIEEIREAIRNYFGRPRQARSLLTDGSAMAPQELAAASRAVWLAIGNTFEEAGKPTNWTNPIPADAQIEGLVYLVAEDGDA